MGYDLLDRNSKIYYFKSVMEYYCLFYCFDMGVFVIFEKIIGKRNFC